MNTNRLNLTYTLMKSKVDKGLCISCGTCIALADKTFAMGDDDKSEVIDQKGNSDDEILNAAKACPVAAIEVVDDSGTKLWPEG